MKPLLIAVVFSLSPQAHATALATSTLTTVATVATVKNDQKLFFLKCNGGAKKQLTTLNLYSGGTKGGIFARIQQGTFDSGEIRIEEPSGMMMGVPENRSYVDVASQGMHFSFSYNMHNPATYSRLDYVNPARKVPLIPEIVCASTRQWVSTAN